MKTILKTILLFILSVNLSSCDSVTRGLDAVDEAINQINQVNDNFTDITHILVDLKDQLDKGEYKDQVEQIISHTGQVATQSLQCSFDFFRSRIIEDLRNLKRFINDEPAQIRVPQLCLPESQDINFTSTSRQSLTILGWNLDVAQQDPSTYRVEIQNENSGTRVVDHTYITYQGQYSITIDISSSGIPFQYGDKKLILRGFSPVFELAIINSDPPAIEKITIISGELKTTNQDREGGFCILRLMDGNNQVWSHTFPEYPRWNDGHAEPFIFSNLNINVPENPIFWITLTQQGAQERNILWRFNAEANLFTDQGNNINFFEQGLSLNCGDGGPATVHESITRVN